MKLNQKKRVRRLVIYFFYDADGIVDRYVPYMLEDISRSCTELFIVCNGKLTSEGRETFRKLTPHIFVRENTGFDVWAYKESLEHYGWDQLKEFDEVVMMNSTIMGPLYPFSEMFDEMNQRDVDFWGITKHHKYPSDPFHSISYGYIPEHVQSHFIAVRKSMLSSMEFQDYWADRPEITSYDMAISQHEAIFTKTFADKGFQWDVYVDTSDLEGFAYYPLTMAPVRMLAQHRCPIFKRRSFFHDYRDVLTCSAGEEGRLLLEYLETQTAYDVSMIWENILRTCHMADIKAALNLTWVLPEKMAGPQGPSRKTALVIHSYFEDLINDCYHYALSMPENSDIYITTDTDKKKKKITSIFSKGPWARVEIIKIENRGRDVSALLVAAAPYLSDYDYVCFMHDKKVGQLDFGIKGYAFSERCFQNLLGSKKLVQNIIDLFEAQPNMGLLCPPTPNHSDYYGGLGCEWGPNFENTKELLRKLEISCPITLDKEPVAPLGTMFWFRPKALEKLTSFGWEYEDFPQEPNAVDGTFLHAVERVYPFVVQAAGYFCAWVVSDQYARTELTNLNYMLRMINTRSVHLFGYKDFTGLVLTMDYLICTQNGSIPSKKILWKRRLKTVIPDPIWRIMRKVYHLFGGKKWVG